MPRVIPPPLSLALTFLREARGWTQQDLATAAGMKRQPLCDLEKGTRRTLQRDVCEKLVALMGYGPGDVTLALLFVGGLDRAAPKSPPVPFAASVEEENQAHQIASRAGLVESNLVYSQLLDLASSRRVEQARREAAEVWDSWRNLSSDGRAKAIESGTGGWALVELLCAESERAASDDAARALDLALLALRAAEHVPGEPGWRSHVQGYALAFRANAQRVKELLLEAEASLALAWQLWRAAEVVAASPFAEWRLLDLEASLRRDQGWFSEALRLLEKAISMAPAPSYGRILIKRAFVYEQAGEIESAWKTLEEATPWIELGDGAFRWSLAMNRAVLLAALGRFAQAENELASLRQMAMQRGNRLDLTRLSWLTGRIAAGLGRSSQARSALEKARQEFIRRGLAVNAALVTIELTVVNLAEGRAIEWTSLEEAAAICRCLGRSQDAMMALCLLSGRRGPIPAGVARSLP